jgi:hypothetical protein
MSHHFYHILTDPALRRGRPLGGDGDDAFQWDPGDGNDTAEGQDGTDTMQFNGNGANEISRCHHARDRPSACDSIGQDFDPDVAE